MPRMLNLTDIFQLVINSYIDYPSYAFLIIFKDLIYNTRQLNKRTYKGCVYGNIRRKKTGSFGFSDGDFT